MLPLSLESRKPNELTCNGLEVFEQEEKLSADKIPEALSTETNDRIAKHWDNLQQNGIECVYEALNTIRRNCAIAMPIERGVARDFECCQTS